MSNKKISFNSIYINELLMAIYLFVFPNFSRLYGNNSYITYGIIAIMLFIYFIYNYKNYEISFPFICIVTISILLFLITYIFNNNAMFDQYFKDFITYGVLSMLFFTKVKNYSVLLKYISYICLILFFISLFDLFNGFTLYSGYMSFGLFCALPSFLIFHIQRKYYHKKLFLIPELLSCVSLLYANRNTIFICMIAVVLFDLFLTKSTLKRKLKYFLIILILVMILYNFETVLSWLFSIFGNDSYALNAMLNWVKGETNGLAGRDRIWSSAFEEINNNPFIGLGIGGYHSMYGIYCHNVFIEFLVSFGYLGLLLFLIIIIGICYKVFLKDRNVFSLYLFVIGILPLLFNDYFMVWKFFWVLLLYAFQKNVVKSQTEKEVT